MIQLWRFFFFFLKRNLLKQELCTQGLYKVCNPNYTWKEQRSRNSKTIEQEKHPKVDTHPNTLCSHPSKLWWFCPSKHTTSDNAEYTSRSQCDGVSQRSLASRLKDPPPSWASRSEHQKEQKPYPIPPSKKDNEVTNDQPFLHHPYIENTN